MPTYENATVLHDEDADTSADTDVLSNDWSPNEGQGATEARLLLTLDSSVVVRIHRSDGSTEIQEDLNDGAAVTANAQNVFTFPVDQSETINVQFAGPATVKKLVLCENKGGA